MSFSEYNQYLYYEFGIDQESDDSLISDSWPFTFTLIEESEILGIPTKIYEFESEKEESYLDDGNSIGFYSKDGLSLSHFKLMLLGNSWIGRQDPIDLDTTDNRIPRIPERKESIKRLWNLHFGEGAPEIMEGLFFKKTQTYLALGKTEDSDKAHVSGDGIVVRNIPFPEISPWKRLSIGIGKLIAEGKIS